MQDRDIGAVLPLVDKARQSGARVLVGIAGAPASGKSTFAERLVSAIAARSGADAAALVPMDGFHLDNAELDARGLRAVKGAAHTFDAAGFVSLVRQVRAGAGSVQFPLFDRALDRTIPGAGRLDAATPVVVFEGNYLLLQDPPWVDLRPLFDVTVMMSVPLPVLRARLVERWLSHGLTASGAEARADGNDMVNARTVIEKSVAADLTLDCGPGDGRADDGSEARPAQ